MQDVDDPLEEECTWTVHAWLDAASHSFLLESAHTLMDIARYAKHAIEVSVIDVSLDCGWYVVMGVYLLFSLGWYLDSLILVKLLHTYQFLYPNRIYSPTQLY